MKRIIILFTLVLPLYAFGQDTLRVGYEFRDFSRLEMGTKRDLVYTEINGRLLSMTIKSRTTERVQLGGKKYISISHSWTGTDTKMNGSFSYLCEPVTLKPVQHIRQTTQKGKEAYLFSQQEITGLDTATNNSAAEFKLTLNTPTYNWEIDLETYSLLPMRTNYTAVMNFYHPGSSTPPDYYTLKVVGSEKLRLPDGRQLDCWILFTDYGGTQPSHFWYTKKGQNFVKMEGKYNQLTIRKERIF